MSLQSRLANLSYEQLLEIAVDGCAHSRRIKNKADALIALVAPLPLHCVDVLLSPDVLPQLFSSLGLSEHAAAGVCRTWSRAYSRQLRRCCYVNPGTVKKLAGVPELPNGLCALPGGVLAISSYTGHHQSVVKFVASAHPDTDPQALAACHARSLAAARRLSWPSGMALARDGVLLVCTTSYNYPNTFDNYPPCAMFKVATDGSMEERATAPALDDYGLGFTRCAVHELTQRTYALAKGYDKQAVVILDAELRVLATIAATAECLQIQVAYRSWFEDEDYKPYLRDVAVHGDQVVLLTSLHPAGPSELLLLDLDGVYQRRMAFGRFKNPWAVTAWRGRAFVVDEGPVPRKKVLHVIDIQSGDYMQKAVFKLDCTPDEISAVCVDGDKIYIAAKYHDRVVGLQLAGSEA